MLFYGIGRTDYPKYSITKLLIQKLQLQLQLVEQLRAHLRNKDQYPVGFTNNLQAFASDLKYLKIIQSHDLMMNIDHFITEKPEGIVFSTAFHMSNNHVKPLKI